MSGHSFLLLAHSFFFSLADTVALAGVGVGSSAQFGGNRDFRENAPTRVHRPIKDSQYVECSVLLLPISL